MLFQKSRKRVELPPLLRRIIDVTTPNLATGTNVNRSENRYNRTLPVLISGWTAKCTIAEPVFFATTRDISDDAMSIVSREELDFSDVVIGIWASPKQSAHPWFFLGRNIRGQKFGGGFNLYAIELYDVANEMYSKQVQSLLPLAELLLPPK